MHDQGDLTEKVAFDQDRTELLSDTSKILGNFEYRETLNIET